MSRSSRLRVLVEVAVMVALGAALSMIHIWKMPQGGSITPGSLVPILLVGWRHGPKWGVLAGVVAGFVNMMIDPYIVHPVQAALDYPIAFGMLGLAGFAAGKSDLLGGAMGAVALFGRFVAHVLSGVVFFAENAGNQNVWLFSIGYNATYMLPEFVVSMVLFWAMIPILRRVVPAVQPRMQ